MRWASLASLLLAVCTLAGCGGETSAPRDGASPGLRDGGLELDGQVDPSGEQDGDEDGLCDDTEERHGSSPDRPDTDGDGLPDLVEVIYGFVPTDPGSPADDEVAYLEARPGAEVRFAVRFTVDGEGGDFAGFFEDSASPYDDGSSAGEYLASSQAIGAEPPEAVRVVERSKQLFRSVLGTTRLELEILFKAGNDVDPTICARAYPFRYGIREDEVGVADDHLYLLVVAPADAEPEDFCQAARCI